MGFLDEIVAKKRLEVKRITPGLMPDGIKRRSLINTVSKAGTALIAEVKRMSPSEGVLRDVDAAERARIYESSGADAVSVLTDRIRFGARNGDLTSVKKSVNVPVLRKDFIVDKLQLQETLCLGADAVLLIAAILGGEIPAYVEEAHGLGLECLVEVHSKDDVRHAMDSEAKLVGINNRDLATLRVDLETFERIAPLMPEDRLLVAESGIRNRADVIRMEAAGADAVLVGSSLMKSGDVRATVSALKGRGTK